MIRFLIPSEKEITRYINVHPEMLTTLLRIIDELGNKFDEDIDLKIIKDKGDLRLIVRCDKYDETVMEKIREIRQSEWYVKTLHFSKGWILLTSDFRFREDVWFREDV